MPRLRKKEIYVLCCGPLPYPSIRKVVRITDTFRGVFHGIGVEFIDIRSGDLRFATLGLITLSGSYFVVTKEEAELIAATAPGLADVYQYISQRLTVEYLRESNIPVSQ